MSFPSLKRRYAAWLASAAVAITVVIAPAAARAQDLIEFTLLQALLAQSAAGQGLVHYFDTSTALVKSAAGAGGAGVGGAGDNVIRIVNPVAAGGGSNVTCANLYVFNDAEKL